MLKWLTKPVQAVDDTLEKVAAAAGAYIGVQAPGLATAYTQRLDEAIDVSEKNLQQWKEMASNLGYPNLDAMIEAFGHSADAQLRGAHNILQNGMGSLDKIQDAYNAIMSAPAWQKPIQAAIHADWDRLVNTWQHYSFQIPTDEAALWYGLAGLVAGGLLYKGAKSAISGLRKGYKARRAERTA